jgi:hypothetical protein
VRGGDSAVDVGSFDVVLSQFVVNFMSDPGRRGRRDASYGPTIDRLVRLGLRRGDEDAARFLGCGPRARSGGAGRRPRHALVLIGRARRRSGTGPACATSRWTSSSAPGMRASTATGCRSRPGSDRRCLLRRAFPRSPRGAARGLLRPLGSPGGPFELSARAWVAVGQVLPAPLVANDACRSEAGSSDRLGFARHTASLPLNGSTGAV